MPPITPGLVTAFNHEKVPGALKQARNVFYRNGYIYPRRPIRQYDASQKWVYGFYNSNRFLIEFTAGTLYRDTGSPYAGPSLTSVSGQAVNVGNGLGENISTFEQNGCTLINGDYSQLIPSLKLDKTDGTYGFYYAGVQRALDLTLTVTGATGFLANNATCAYRLVWGYYDNQKNLILGPPSGRFTTTGTAGGGQNVIVKSYIPSELKTSGGGAANAGLAVFCLLYRTTQVTTGSPDEEYRLADGNFITSTDQSNGYVQWTDITPDSMLGAYLYTNQSKEGAAAANYQPPFCTDSTTIKSIALYSNTSGKYRFSVSMLAAPDQLVVSTGAGGFTKSGANLVVTFTGSPDLSGIDTSCVLAINDATSAGNVGVFPVVSVDNTAKTITATNAGAVTEAGKTTSRGLASGLTIAGVRYNAVFTEDIPNKRYVAGISGTTSQDVGTTANSLMRCVNANSSATVYCHNDSKVNDPPGFLAFESRAYGSFSVQAFGNKTSAASGGSTYADKFAPDLNTAQSATNDAAANRFYYAKPNQPEHVPLTNYWDVGKRQYGILRSVALRENVYFFKADGLYRAVSDGNTIFAPVLVDETIQALSYLSVGVLNNRIYALTNKGPVVISDGGGAVLIGKPVEDIFQPQIDLGFSGGNGTTYGSVAVNATDETVDFTIGCNNGLGLTNYPVKTIVFHASGSSAGAWAQWDSGGDTTLFIGPSVQLNRQTFRFSRGTSPKVYCDEGIDADATSLSPAEESLAWPLPADKRIANVTGQSGSDITITTSGQYSTPAVGDIFIATKDNISSWTVTAVNGSTVTLAANVTNGGDTVTSVFGGLGKFWFAISTPMTVEWQPITAGDISLLKRFTDFQVALHGKSDATALTASVYNELNSTSVSAASTTRLFAPWWLVPPSMQLCQRLSIIFTCSQRLKYAVIAGLSLDYEAEPEGVPLG